MLDIKQVKMKCGPVVISGAVYCGLSAAFSKNGKEFVLTAGSVEALGSMYAVFSANEFEEHKVVNTILGMADHAKFTP